MTAGGTDGPRIAADVVILGSGIAGGILGSILARQGLDVVIVDQTPHPKFAVGESTIPQTSQLLSILARTYDVPELEWLGMSSPDALREHVTRSCGIKRTFGFVYHRNGERPVPGEAHQFGNVWRTENHLFRQDIDAFLFHTALAYGCRGLTGSPATDVDLRDDGVSVVLEDGTVIDARFMADGTGRSGALSRKMGLIRDVPELTHHSRASFTHMLNVSPFEEVEPNALSVKWSEGTLHHVFDGGWIWVIPFNNWQGSTNPLVSVGLQLDPRRWPLDTSISPEDEFRSFIAEVLPSVSQQFKAAATVRPWVRTGRLQHDSVRSVGDRFCLLAHAAGFVDALYSRGLISTMEVIAALVPRVLEACEDDVFTAEHFAPVERAHLMSLHFADRLVAGSYYSWRSFELWDRFMRVWAIGTGVAESNLSSHLMMGDRSTVALSSDPIFSTFEDPGYRAFFEGCERVLLDHERGVLDDDAAISALDGVLSSYRFAMPLRDDVRGQEWALRTPGCRDIHLGVPHLHERWMAEVVDP